MEGIQFDEYVDAHKNHPDKFWQAYLNYVIINKYTLDIEPRLNGDMKAFALKLIQENPQKEVHHWCIKADDFWEVHFFAQTEEQKQDPVSVTIGYLPFPNEHFYVFMITRDITQDKLHVDVFCPHFFERYAARAERHSAFEEQLPAFWLPKNWRDTAHKIPKTNELSAIHMQDLAMLKGFVGKFIGNNKIFLVRHNPAAESVSKQEIDGQKVRPTILLPCGVCFGDYYCDQNLVLHKTFLSFSQLKKDQFKALAKDFAIMMDTAHQLFPKQYEDFWEGYTNWLKAK